MKYRRRISDKITTLCYLSIGMEFFVADNNGKYAIDLHDVDKVYKGKVHALRGIEMISTVRLINQEAVGLSGERISFSFGENWKKYLSSLGESTIRSAEDSFTTFTRLSTLDDDTFLDIGCGSDLPAWLLTAWERKESFQLTLTRIASIA